MKVYEKIFRSQQAQAGVRTVWGFKWFYEGMLQKVVVKQVDGQMLDFTIDIYNSKKVQSHSGSSGGPDPDGSYAADPEMYRVLPTMTAPAGETVTLLETAGRAYRNMDGSQSVPERMIYVAISIPAGSGPCTFDVCLGGWTDVG